MNNTTYDLRLPTIQYGYIEAHVEGTPSDAVLAYKELERAWNGGQGVGIKTLAEILIEYVRTGGIPSGGNYDFSTNEGLLLKEVGKVLRKEKE